MKIASSIKILKFPDFSRILDKMLKFPDFSLIFWSNINFPDFSRFSRFSRLRGNPADALIIPDLKNGTANPLEEMAAQIINFFGFRGNRTAT